MEAQSRKVMTGEHAAETTTMVGICSGPRAILAAIPQPSDTKALCPVHEALAEPLAG